MDHKVKRILSIALISVLLTAVFPEALSAQAAESTEFVGATSGSEEVFLSDLSDDEIIDSVSDYADFAGTDEASLVGTASASALPSECDNSTNENAIYFPPVGNQNVLNACACWSSTYYLYTYTNHRAFGIPTTNENIFSPIWTYNLSNNGTLGGSNSPRNYNIIGTMGCATVSEVPAVNVTEPETNYLSWHAEDGIWKGALENRLTSYGYFTTTSITDGYNTTVGTPVPDEGTPITSPTDSDLDMLKAALSNGDILCYNSFITSWKYKDIKSTNTQGVDNRFVNETAAYVCAGTQGGHGMTLVGYNDNIWVDINDNNRVDSGEMGAFKIANSWGTYYGNRGFCWVAYDALNKVSSVNGAMIFSNRQCIFNTVSTIKVENKKYNSDIYLKYVLNSGERANTLVYVNATEKANPANSVTKLLPPYGLDDYINYIDTVCDHTYNGTTTADDGEMYYDLNNVVPNLSQDNLNDYTWKITVSDRTNNNKSLIIKELSIVDDANGGVFDLLGTGTITLNGSSKVFTTSNIDFPFTAQINVASAGDLCTAEQAVITAAPIGGTAPYKYTFELVKGYETITIANETTSNVCYKHLYESGDYILIATIKDAKGKTASASTSITVKQTTIDALEPNTSSASVGNMVVITPTVSNLASCVRYLDFHYTVTKNGVSQSYTPNYDKQLVWTPTEGGNYTITCGIVYNDIDICSKTIDFTVSDNSATIYYKGYSNPNIHYQVGSGSWTAVPGVKMTATSEISGYTHKYTISLGSASYANVCFNNGSGNWDSNNGANYRFLSGYYKYSNGTITKFDPTPAQLSADVSLSETEIVRGTPVTLTASAENGKAPYSYKIAYVYGSSENTLCEYSARTQTSFAPQLAGTYTIKAYVKDSAGKTAMASKLLVVKDPILNYVTASKTNVKTGESVTFSMNVSNAVSSLVYRYEVITSNGTTTLTTNSDKTASWTPSSAGTYTVTGSIISSGAVLSSKTVTVNVEEAPANNAVIYYKGYSTPYIHYQVGSGSWTSVPGVKMTASSEVSGYTHKYTIDLGSASYANVCFNNGSGSWDSNNGSNYRFQSGYYKYSNGTITKFDPTPAGLSANLTLSASEIINGGSVEATATAANGKAPYQYKFTYTSGGVTQTLSDFSTGNSVVFVPGVSGSYTITVTVKDADGKTAMASKDLAMKNPSVASVNTSRSSASVGQTVKLTLGVNDSMSALTYRYKVVKNGVEKTLTTSSDKSANWTPTEAGEYAIIGCILYNGEVISSKSIAYTVDDAVLNTITIYYKGYANPNIHYQVGSGSWTNVPGVKMTATSEVSGYTHKYTIDLGNSTYANVCFNDGNGNWDSRNGANYRFTQGTFKYSNGTITAM